jgi:hypothetical protein
MHITRQQVLENKQTVTLSSIHFESYCKFIQNTSQFRDLEKNMIKCSPTVQIVDCKHFNFLLHDWKQNTKSDPSFILVFFSFSVAASLTGGIGLESNNTHRLNYLQELRRLIKHKQHQLLKTFLSLLKSQHPRSQGKFFIQMSVHSQTKSNSAIC